MCVIKIFYVIAPVRTWARAGKEDASPACPPSPLTFARFADAISLPAVLVIFILSISEVFTFQSVIDLPTTGAFNRPTHPAPAACFRQALHNAAQRSIALHSAEHSAEHSAAQRSTAQHSAAQRSTAQHGAGQHDTAQHSRRATPQHTTGTAHAQHHSATQHRTAQHSTAQRSTVQHRTAHHSTARRRTARHSAPQRSTAQHSTAQHSTAHCSTAQYSA